MLDLITYGILRMSAYGFLAQIGLVSDQELRHVSRLGETHRNGYFVVVYYENGRLRYLKDKLTEGRPPSWLYE